jgi:glycogen debranching enzyme
MTLALKEGPVVVVSADDGSMANHGALAFGLYAHDVRFLSAFELTVNGVRPVLLSGSDRETYVATIQLINPAFQLPDGRAVPAQSLSIRRTRFVDGALRERVGVLNCLPQPIPVELAVTFGADFQDIFAVRGYRPLPPPVVQRRLREGALVYAAIGRDGALRTTTILSTPRPDVIDGDTFRFRRTLEPQGLLVVEFAVAPRISAAHGGAQPMSGGPGTAAAGNERSTMAAAGTGSATPLVSPAMDAGARLPHGARRRPFDLAVVALRDRHWSFLRASTSIRSSREAFDLLLRRSALDLRALLDLEPEGPVPTAGIPWFAAPFGRDALVVGFETLIYNPDLAVGTLRFLARHQGRRVDPETEEEPGKILHELRRGELARAGLVPHHPYYGTVDATPLFAWLVGETVRWLDDGRLYRELLPHADAALRWCDEHADPGPGGFVVYTAEARDALRNKGWKDSAISLSRRDGTPAPLPAALVEVQAYVYAAKRILAELAARDGDRPRAVRLEREARELQERFEDAFWLPDEGCYAQAIDADGHPIDAVTSNAGHALWAGIASPERAAVLARRLMAPDLFTGWGLRTLSSHYPTYNPMSYHNGSVWPHDTAIVAAGLARYGFREEANRLATGIVEAALTFPEARLPELFCGFARDERFSSRPAEYQVSCSPQAWAAGAPFLILQAILDLRVLANGEPAADPVLPAWLDWLALRRLRIAGRRWALRVRRTRRGIRLAGGIRLAPRTETTGRRPTEVGA